jgi:NhaP-type Na+/H+ or K+/H+ antiporter
MEGPGPTLTFAVALGAGVLGHGVARHLRVPAIVPLLALGVILGPDLLGWVWPDALGAGLFSLVELAVAVILFEGGLNLEIGRLSRENRPIRMLVTVGAVVTAVGGTLAARIGMGWPWDLSVLFGTLVIVTGPTVIGPLLRNVPVRPRLATILEAEGVLIDPIGAIIAAVALQIVVGAHEPLSPGSALLLRLGFGTAAGLVFGFALAGLLRVGRVVPEGLENLVALGGALVLFEGCNAVLSQTGILAVTVAGVVVGNVRTRVSRELRDFQEHLTVGLIGILFVLLAADVRLADVRSLGWHGLFTVAALLLLVRPANVLASTVGSELDLRDRAYLSWIAPRGIVAASIASLFAAVLHAAGIPGGPELRALVFLTIAVTVVLQGGSAGLVARLLGVRAPAREAITILGAEELALALGESLRAGGRRVIFLDANPGHCRAAEERGFQVVFGNALEERTLARARLELVAAAVGLTPNNEVNSLFAREAKETFRVPETYVATGRSEGIGVTRSLLEKQGSHALFDRPKDVERWTVRIRHGAARIQTFRFEGAPEKEPEEAAEAARSSALDPYIILAVKRGEAALEALRELGWVPEA